jgi:hypothetical protein
MASDILHIKDSYYFEIPKVLLPRQYSDKSQFPDVWVKLDDQFQDWELNRLHHELEHLAEEHKFEIPNHEDAHHAWHEWMHHNHAHHGKPFDVYLEEHAQALNATYQTWLAKAENKGKSFDDFLETKPQHREFAWFARHANESEWESAWTKAKLEAGDVEAFKKDKTIDWSEQKLKFYNHHLSGKILIPQPFGELRNFYQAESTRACPRRS